MQCKMWQYVVNGGVVRPGRQANKRARVVGFVGVGRRIGYRALDAGAAGADPGKLD